MNILEGEPTRLLGYRASKIVALCGDGSLRDGSECSRQLKEYLEKVKLQKLYELIQDTLTQKFPNSGFALQDFINEVGRRLGFQVTNGRYHGVVNKPGFDGFWVANEMALLVEVKTTDAFRINLSTLAEYAKQLIALQPKKKDRFGILIVVGRQDTGDLEAQIRGSKFAWDIRVISAEALVTLASLYEIAVDQTTTIALQTSLFPVEYTRVDHLIELLSKLAFDVERSTIATDVVLESDSATISNVTPPHTLGDELNLDNIEVVREKVFNSIIRVTEEPLSRLSRSTFKSDSGATYVIAVSKFYTNAAQQYWYALHEKWMATFQKNNSNLCLAMLGKQYYFRLPAQLVSRFPDSLNKTQKGVAQYWNIGLMEVGEKMLMQMPKVGKPLEITKYKVDFRC